VLGLDGICFVNEILPNPTAIGHAACNAIGTGARTIHVNRDLKTVSRLGSRHEFLLGNLLGNRKNFFDIIIRNAFLLNQRVPTHFRLPAKCHEIPLNSAKFRKNGPILTTRLTTVLGFLTKCLPSSKIGQGGSATLMESALAPHQLAVDYLPNRVVADFF
jgi:hypothetical protein